MNRPDGEIRALTGARGIAAWFVVMFHIYGAIAGLPPLVGDLFAHGYLAVDFFFLLSGFVIWLRWNDRFRTDRWAAVAPFLRKRIARIWPLHAVTLAATAVMALALVAAGRPDPVAFPFPELPLNIVLLQNWGFTGRLAWNVPSWSISAELGAYVLFPLVVIGVDWRRLSTPALLAGAGLLVMALTIAISASSSATFDIPRLGLLRCVCEFLTGTIACALWVRGAGQRGAMVLAAIATALWAMGWPETLTAPVVFAALLYLLAENSATNVLSRCLPHFLGEISYATYLCHYPMWLAVRLVYPADVPPFCIAAYAVIVIVCSTLLYRHVERPAQRWIDGLGRSPKPVCALP